MNNKITFDDCTKALNRFIKATDRAEQHQFVALALHHAMLNRTYNKLAKEWDEEVAKNMIDHCNRLCKQLGATEEVSTNA